MPWQCLVFISVYPVNTKHLNNICTMLDQRQRRWPDVVQNVIQNVLCELGMDEESLSVSLKQS